MSETPESNPGALVVSGPKALAVANRQLRIAGQALARIERERYIEFFATHPEASWAFVDAVSLCYPCSEALIERHTKLWNWKWLSRNEALPWSEALIQRHAALWDWAWLSGNEALPWSEALLDCYAERWNWGQLNPTKAVPCSEHFIERYLSHWGLDGWRNLSHNEVLPWSAELIDRYADVWHWDSLALNHSLPWTEDFIDRYADRWNWKSLSSSSCFEKTEALLGRYVDRWHWNWLSVNPMVPWSVSLIERYIDRWNWRALSVNSLLPWSQALIDRFLNYWYWSSLSRNEGLPWSEALLDRYADRWNWKELSGNEALPWTESLISHYANSWDWSKLSSNANLPWSGEFVARYAEFWHWERLGGNEALPWHDGLLKKYADRWPWGQIALRGDEPVNRVGRGQFTYGHWPYSYGLHGNKALPWSEALIVRYADQWYWPCVSITALTKLLLAWDESSIGLVMDRIVSKESRRPRHPLIQQALDILDEIKAEQRSALPSKPTHRVTAVPRAQTLGFEPPIINLQRLMLRNLLKSSKRMLQAKAGEPMTWKELAMQAAVSFRQACMNSVRWSGTVGAPRTRRGAGRARGRHRIVASERSGRRRMGVCRGCRRARPRCWAPWEVRERNGRRASVGGGGINPERGRRARSRRRPAPRCSSTASRRRGRARRRPRAVAGPPGSRKARPGAVRRYGSGS